MASVDSRRRAATLYGGNLRKALEETGTSVYRLARIINPAQPESTRSSIQRYLAGRVLPGIESRHELSEALGRPELLSVPDEDDERDPMVALMDAIRQITRSEISREQAVAASPVSSPDPWR